MLDPVAPGLWHRQHRFSTFGIGTSTRMTVVRLGDGTLWVHSPVPLAPDLRARVVALGDVAWIVAPNRFHHLYAGEWAAAFPHATLLGAPGLAAKRPDLALRTLGPVPEPAWARDLGQVFVAGLPMLNETVWCHHASRSLIVTDVLQYVNGQVPLSARLYTGLMGVYHRVAVPNAIRLAIRDRAAFARSVESILAWDFDRVVFAHNVILENNAHGTVRAALEAVL